MVLFQRPRISVLDFFTAKPVEKVYVERGQTDGRCVVDKNLLRRVPVQSKRSYGKDYVEEFRNLEFEENVMPFEFFKNAVCEYIMDLNHFQNC